MTEEKNIPEEISLIGNPVGDYQRLLYNAKISKYNKMPYGKEKIVLYKELLRLKDEIVWDLCD